MPRAKRDWEAIAKKLKRKPGQPVLLPEFTNTPSATSVTVIVNRDRPFALRALGGTVRASMRNAHYTDGRKHADIYLTWTPEEGT